MPLLFFSVVSVRLIYLFGKFACINYWERIPKVRGDTLLREISQRFFERLQSAITSSCDTRNIATFNPISIGVVHRRKHPNVSFFLSWPVHLLQSDSLYISLSCFPLLWRAASSNSSVSTTSREITQNIGKAMYLSTVTAALIFCWHLYAYNCQYRYLNSTGSVSLIGSVPAWHVSGPEFDPHVRHIISWRLGHEKISTAILPLPLIQEEQLSVCALSTDKLPRRLAQEQCG